MIRSSEGVLILPIREKLFINIQDSFIADDLNYTSCYVSDFPCCVDFPTNPICPPCPSFEPSPTPTITPSLTPDLSIGLTLFSVITSGSIVVTYNLVATMPVFTEISLDFSHVLGTTGNPIVITTGVTLNQGSTSSILVITLDEDSETLTNNAYFSGVSINPPQYSSFFTASETTIFQITPTTTPTPTVTPTNPCVQYITDELGNLILTEEGDYIVSELNPCITPTPTPTITQTSNPTPTPTPSITETSTPTPTPTTTETPTQTPTNTETPTQTPTNTLTPTPSSTPPTNYWEITNCSSVFNIIVNFGAYVPNQGEIYNLTMVGYSPPNNWNCWQVVGTSAGPPFAPVQTINSGPWVDCPSCPL
jgi:hypothetical protein